MTLTQRIKNLQPPKGHIDVVLDTDTYNEIDDQFALSYLIRSPEKCTVVGLHAAPFFNENSTGPADGMERSYDEILKLLKLARREDLNAVTYKGSDRYLPDEKTPVDSPAARHLVELSKGYSSEHPLYVAAIGAITNVASALLMDETVKENIVLVWLGGHSRHYPDTREFNMFQDVAAARVVFGCGVPLVQLPCQGVVSAFYTTAPELNYWLKGKNELCDYLVEHTCEAANAYAAGKVWSRVIWDVTAVGWLLNEDDRFMDTELIPAPIPEYDDHYAFDQRRHFIAAVWRIKRDELFRDLFDKLSR